MDYMELYKKGIDFPYFLFAFSFFVKNTFHNLLENFALRRVLCPYGYASKIQFLTNKTNRKKSAMD
jgi:hypothetical protein